MTLSLLRSPSRVAEFREFARVPQQGKRAHARRGQFNGPPRSETNPETTFDGRPRPKQQKLKIDIDRKAASHVVFGGDDDDDEVYADDSSSGGSSESGG